MQRSPIVVALIIIASIAFTAAQFSPYTSAPVNLYTFDSPPMFPPAVYGAVITTNTHFTWTNTLLSPYTTGHYGVAQFNGLGDMINMNLFPDANGQNFTAAVGGGGIAFEVWAINTASISGARYVDISNGYYVNNTWMWVDTTNELAWRSFAKGTEYSSTVASNVLYEDLWQHLLCQITPTSTTAGTMSCYINGVLQAGSTANAGLPDLVTRSQAFFGQIPLGVVGFSQPAVTATYCGYVDMFAIYNTSLSAEAVQAHAQLIRPPAFEVYFATDPHNITGVTGTDYTWLSVDSSDITSVQQYHSGLISLRGATGQYVDLSTSAGVQSVGTTLTSTTIGGVGSGVLSGSYYNGIATGFTLELAIKITSGAVASRVFSTGNGVGNNEIYVSYNPSTTSLTFTVANGGSASPLVISSTAAVGTWLHLVVVLQANSAGTATSCVTYENGVVGSTVSTCTYPSATTRSLAFLGYSGVSSDATFNGLIDFVRVYDYALSPTNIGVLYVLTVSGLPTTTPFTYTPSPLTTTGPILAYTFDSALPSNFDYAAHNTNYTYLSSSGTHNGIGQFNGAFSSPAFPTYQQNVDMNMFADTYNNTMPVLGGAFSVEMWFQFTGVASTTALTTGYEEVFTIVGPLGYNQDAIYLRQYQYANGLQMATFNGTSETQGTVTANAFVVGQWEHFVLTITPGATLKTATSDWYLNGVQTQHFTSLYTPLYVQRPVAFLGKSSVGGNANFNGSFDAVYFYNYALSNESVAVHYVVPKAPIIELSFATNPLITNPSATYFWTQYDPITPAVQRSGLLSLNGTTSPSSNVYVNLSSPSGTNSLYTTWPIIGGLSNGNGLTLTQKGWSIEVIFQSSTVPNAGANIYEFGSGNSNDSISLGFDVSTSNIHFAVANSNGYSSSLTAIQSAVVSSWYQVVAVMSPSSQTPVTGSLNIYVNGILVSCSNSTAYPLSVARPASYLGHSSTGGNTWTGEIDALRIYDYAMNDAQVAALANVTALLSPNRSTITDCAAILSPVSSSSSTGNAGPAQSSATQTQSSTSTGAHGTSISTGSTAPTSAVSVSSSSSSNFSVGCIVQTIPSGSTTAQVLINLDFTALTPTFFASFQTAVANSLGMNSLASQLTSCVSVLGSAGQHGQVTAISSGQTQVTFSLQNYNGTVNTANELAQLQSANGQSNLNAQLTTQLGTTAVPNSLVAVNNNPNNNNNGGSSGLSNGAIAGIVVGSFVGCILILIVLVFLCRSCRDDGAKEKQTTYGRTPDTADQVEMEAIQQDQD